MLYVKWLKNEVEGRACHRRRNGYSQTILKKEKRVNNNPINN